MKQKILSEGDPFLSTNPGSFCSPKASIEAWKKRVDETVMTDDSARFGTYRRQLDELSAAITQLHRR